MAMQVIQDDILLTFKEAQNYLRVSRSTLYRLMWSGQLTGHKVGSTWRFYRENVRACVGGPQVVALSSQVAHPAELAKPQASRDQGVIDLGAQAHRQFVEFSSGEGISNPAFPAPTGRQ